MSCQNTIIRPDVADIHRIFCSTAVEHTFIGNPVLEEHFTFHKTNPLEVANSRVFNNCVDYAAIATV